MRVGDRLAVLGFVTQAGYLEARRLNYIEEALGYAPGRLSSGAWFATLDRLPRMDEFETAGYSQVPGHRHKMSADLDPVRIKRLAASVWSAEGRDRLVKVIPFVPNDPRQDDDAQYPPGLGIPQWRLTKPVPGIVRAVISGYTEFLSLT